MTLSSEGVNDGATNSDPLARVRAGYPDKAIIVAQLGQTLDGRIATESGDSRWINGAGGLDHLHGLRSLVDAIVVGAGTVIADDPQLTVRRVALGDRDGQPARVVIDPNGRVSPQAKIFTDDGARRIVVRGYPMGSSDSALQTDATSSQFRDLGVEVLGVGADDGLVPPAALVDTLGKAGLHRLLIEGGAWTVSSFVAADAIDLLHLIVSPMILGSGRMGLKLPEIDRIRDAKRPEVCLHVLQDGDVLFDCDLRVERAIQDN